MARRTFPILTRLSDNKGGGIVDVPHTAVFRYASPEDILNLFEQQWGVAAEGVILPVTNGDGLLYPVEGLSESLSAHAIDLNPRLKDYRDIIYSFAEKGLDIYLMVDPTLTFIGSNPLHLVDIVGDSSRQVCIGNPRSQDVIGAILGTGVDIVQETTRQSSGKLKGVVIDAVDLWPMGANAERLELTCFCPSCERYFADAKPGLLRRFKTSPNPWNLLLRDSGSGIEHINEIRSHYGPDDIVGLSRQKGFDKAFRDATTQILLEQARDVLDYIEARHNETISAVNTIFDQALHGLDPRPRRILLTEGMYYSWTAGLQLERLDIEKKDGYVVPYDEVWFDLKSNTLGLKQVDFRSYMWSRSRYMIDSFFQLASNAGDAEIRASTGIARLSAKQLKERLKSRLAQTLACMQTGLTSLSALPDMKATNSDSCLIGFVGTALTKEMGERFIEVLRIAPGQPEESDDDAPTELQNLITALRQRGQTELN